MYTVTKYLITTTSNSVVWAISCSSQCTTTGVTKAVVCVVMSVG